jgi:hypothetical protein
LIHSCDSFNLRPEFDVMACQSISFGRGGSSYFR